MVDGDSRTAMLTVLSTVTRWGEQPPSVKVGGESPEAEFKEFVDATETTRVPASGASVTVDRPNIAAQEVAANLRVPLGQPVLIGGLTLAPASDAGQQPDDGQREQLYLVVETSIVRPADRDDEK